MANQTDGDKGDDVSLFELLREAGIEIPEGGFPSFQPLVRIDENWGGIFCLTEDCSYCAHRVTGLFDLFLINHEDERCVGFRIACPGPILSRIVAILDALDLPRDIITLEHVLKVTQTISLYELKDPIPVHMLEQACEIARKHNCVLTREQYEPFLTTPKH